MVLQLQLKLPKKVAIVLKLSVLVRVEATGRLEALVKKEGVVEYGKLVACHMQLANLCVDKLFNHSFQSLASFLIT